MSTWMGSRRVCSSVPGLTLVGASWLAGGVAVIARQERLVERRWVRHNQVLEVPVNDHDMFRDPVHWDISDVPTIWSEIARVDHR